MGAVRVTPTTKPSCSCMDNAGEAPSPSTLNSLMATRAAITPPWADGGGTCAGGATGLVVGAVESAALGGGGAGAGKAGAAGAGKAGCGLGAAGSARALGWGREIHLGG